MTEIENELAAALRVRRGIIADEESRQLPEQHLRRLQEISQRIDTLAAALPRPLAPRLAHYLDRCSYDKALEFLEQKSPDAPSR